MENLFVIGHKIIFHFTVCLSIGFDCNRFLLQKIISVLHYCCLIFFQMNSNLNIEASFLLMTTIILRMKIQYCQVFQPEKLKKKNEALINEILITQTQISQKLSKFLFIEHRSFSQLF